LGKSTDCHVAITILEIKRVKILTFKIFHPILMQFVFCKMMGYCFHYKKNLPILKPLSDKKINISSFSVLSQR
jgi:hypothetical protein